MCKGNLLFLTEFLVVLICVLTFVRLTRPGFASNTRPMSAVSQVEVEGAAQAINMVISQVRCQEYGTVDTTDGRLHCSVD